MALLFDEESRCPCGCGQYVDQAHTRDWNWDVDHFKCYAGAALDQVRREFDKKHKDDPSRNDGRIWTVAPVKPK